MCGSCPVQFILKVYTSLLAATRLITGVRQCDHVTPALHQLHWLPVRRQVDFKISTLVYRLLAGTAPVYLADECTLVTTTGRHPLQSSDN